MTLIHLDTCGCRLLWDNEKDQVAGYYGDPCELHKDAPVSAPLAECRAKNATIEAAADSLKIPADQVLWNFDADRKVHAIKLDLVLGKVETIASSEPLDHAAFVAAIEDPDSLKVV